MVLYVVALSLLGAFLFQEAPRAGESVQELRERLQARQDSIGPVHAVLDVKDYESVMDPAGPAPSRVGRLRTITAQRQYDRIRFTEERAVVGKALRPVLHVAWNGQRSTGYTHSPDDEPARRYSGVIEASRGAVFYSGLWRSVLEDNFIEDEYTFAELLGAEGWHWSVSRGDDAERGASYHLRGILAGDGWQWVAELWLDENLGLMPFRWQKTIVAGSPSQTWSTRVEVLESREIKGRAEGKRLFVPWLAEAVVRNPSGIGRHRVEVLEYELRDPWPQDHFTVRFPVGTAVADSINEVGFVAGKQVHVLDPSGVGVLYLPIDDYPEYAQLTDFSRGLTEEEWKRTVWFDAEQAKRTLATAGPRPVRWQAVFWMAVVAACFVACAAFWIRGRRRPTTWVA